MPTHLHQVPVIGNMSHFSLTLISEEEKREWRKKKAHVGARAQTRDLPGARRESVAPRHSVCFDK